MKYIIYRIVHLVELTESVNLKVRFSKPLLYCRPIYTLPCSLLPSVGMLNLLCMWLKVTLEKMNMLVMINYLLISECSTATCSLNWASS